MFLAFSVGILAGDIFFVRIPYLIPVWVFCFLLLILSRFIEKIRSISILIFFTLLGFSFHSYDIQKNEFEDFNSKQKIVFQIVKKINSSEKNSRYIVEITDIIGNNDVKTPFYSIFSLPKQKSVLDFSSMYHGEFFINKISPPENIYQFDYQKYMLRKGVAYQIYSKEMPKSVPKELLLSDKIKQLRLNILQNIDNSGISSKSQDFLKGIILADRTDMDSDISRDFTRSGLVHLLSISGTHMVIIFLIFMGILKFILPFKLKKIAVITSLVLIWCYSVFIDYGNSVVRACLMLSIYYISVLLRRKPDLLHSMGIAGLVILAWDSQQIFNVGFQLSFLAVLGIYWLNRPILDLFPKTHNKFYKILQNVISVTISAQIITLPLILYYFHQFSFISIISNIIIVPFAELIISLSLFIAVILGLGGNVQIFNLIYDEIIKILLKLIHFFAEIEFLFFDNIHLSIYEVISVFVIIYLIRFLLIGVNLKIIIKFGFSVLIFLLFRLGLDIYYFYTEEFLEHSYNKKKIFSIRNKSHVIFYLPENLDRENLEKYLIKPYVLHSRSDSYEIREFNDSDVTHFRYKNEIKNLR